MIYEDFDATASHVRRTLGTGVEYIGFLKSTFSHELASGVMDLREEMAPLKITRRSAASSVVLFVTKSLEKDNSINVNKLINQFNSNMRLLKSGPTALK